MCVHMLVGAQARCVHMPKRTEDNLGYPYLEPAMFSVSQYPGVQQVGLSDGPVDP